MAGKARLRCVALNITLELPWWPTEITRSLSVRTVGELDRPDALPLAVPSGLTPDDYSVGYMLRQDDWREPVGAHIRDLERIAASKKPVQLLLADQSEGLFRVESATVTALEFAESGQVSVADVSLTLKRASDAVVNVGLVKRIKGRATNLRRP
jgi:hypothetical protein